MAVYIYIYLELVVNVLSDYIIITSFSQVYLREKQSDYYKAFLASGDMPISSLFYSLLQVAHQALL